MISHDIFMERLAEYLQEYAVLRKIVFSKPADEQAGTIIKVAVHPVLIGGKLLYQFTSYDKKKAIARNYEQEEAVRAMEETANKDFRYINVIRTDVTIEMQRLPGGAILSRRSPPQSGQGEPDFSHDRKSAGLISAENSQAVLAATGFLIASGGVKPTMQKKFRQVNEFIRLFDESAFMKEIGADPLEIVDCGCGNAYLTFLLYHYLSGLRRIPLRLTGIDRDPDSLARNAGKAETLGYAGLEFIRCEIEEFQPVSPPDVVLSLHACDTATDQAIALGIRSKSRLILCAPCCHHHLNRQLKTDNDSLMAGALARYGLLLEKTGDVLTDSFRVMILSLMGYSVSTVKFVDPENTERNLLIKAEWQGRRVDRLTARQYGEMKTFWKVTPFLETILGELFSRRLESG